MNYDIKRDMRQRKGVAKSTMDREYATDRIRTFPSDGKRLRLLAKEKGGRTTPAHIINELLK